jgi:hypothetical protein
MAERIPIGSDHAGFALKQQLINELRAEGYEPDDLGTYSTESTDYPDFAHAVASQVEHGDGEPRDPAVWYRAGHGIRGEPASGCSRGGGVDTRGGRTRALAQRR